MRNWTCNVIGNVRTRDGWMVKKIEYFMDVIYFRSSMDEVEVYQDLV